MASNIGNWFENGTKVLDRTQKLNSDGAMTGVVLVPSVAGAVGSVSGWVGTAGYATLPQSQTSSQWNIPININVGDTIESYKVIGQIDSAGNTATLDANLFKLTSAVSGSTATGLGSITQVSATADTLVGSSKTLGTPEVVAAGESFFVRITGTTAATTDIEVVSIEVTIV